ncbi:MAG: nicotinate phosphoribosyltransferase [Spirochaetales bacterium]|nr:nicotinate phosphoribosyltransferase [Spirochaetales bacterium]
MSESAALLTDLYELTMMQGYFAAGKNPRAVFEMFFRRPPFGGAFAVFAGLEPLIESLAALRFTPSDCEYLDSLKLFTREFLDWLAAFRFRADVRAHREGALVFPGEPLLQVAGGLLEAQLVESLVLNTINFQTLVATKAARVWLASGRGDVIEFGLRRAQGPDGALSAARAAYIGGAGATSNVLAGKRFGIPVRGTMAHSWVKAFAGEREAFAAYARSYPDGCVLLIDTIDTLKSGLPHAIETGLALKAEGRPLAGVRLDSGDLLALSRRVRRGLDRAGLADAKIIASNDLDERSIARLTRRKAPIDVWGVGTRLVTGQDDPSLTGVYKLAAYEEAGRLKPVMKRSDSPEKSSLPGEKQVYRVHDRRGAPQADVIALEGETIGAGTRIEAFTPAGGRRVRLEAAFMFPLLAAVMERGEPAQDRPSLAAVRGFARRELERFDPAVLTLARPKSYPVFVSRGLHDLRRELGAFSGSKEGNR